MAYITKNYSADGGDTLVIGGKLIVKEEAEVEGLNTELPVASAAVLGGVKVGEGLSITQSGTLSADSTPIASAEVLGGIKVGSGLSISADGVLSVSGSGAPHATLTSYGVVKQIPYQYLTNSGKTFEEVMEIYNTFLANLKAAGQMATS